MRAVGDIKKNEAFIKRKLENGDAVFSNVSVGGKKALLIYIDALVDNGAVSEHILKPLYKLRPPINADKLVEKLPKAGSKVTGDLDGAVNAVIDGQAVLLVDKMPEAVLFDVKKPESRTVAEPPTSAVVKGPREGFTESIKTNLSLIRRRLKTNELKIEKFKVGRVTKTDVFMLYLNNVTDDKVVEKVKSRVGAIDIDGVIDSSYIAKFIAEHKASLFKQSGTTEKPDILAAKMLEGRVGILVDGSPIALTVPYLLFEDFQSSEDYFQNSYRSNMARMIRLISITLAILLPSVFVSAQLFHLQIIPLNFLLTIVNSIKGIPLSPSLEMFFTLVVFEILNEASIRMPKYVGMALSIVGALVLGDTAVRAGIVSTPAIMIMALSGICLYTVPELVDSMSFLRLIFLFTAGSLGGFGIVVLSAMLLVYLVSLENFDTPFLAPFAPLVKEDLKDGALMTFLPDMTTRPVTLKPKNKVRIKVGRNYDGRRR
ncbi:MAG: spore germination protein [Clostridia bacterium]|nr:spore germination protein [Clostridia bacterium]